MELNHLLPILLLSFCTCVLSAESDLSQSAYLDPKERFHIEWEYTDTNITITARVKTTGWFGLGFSPNGGMTGADIITAGFANGKPYLQDRYAERNGYPAVDDSQDVQLLSGSQENGVTTIKFTRKHTTCDNKDMPIGTDTVRLIYAISADGSDTISYHAPSNRGTRSIYLRRKIKVEPEMPADAFTFDITVDKVKIPAFHTRYFCEVKRAPILDGKHHMIKAEPVIQEGNLGFVHHMLLYGCFDKKNRDHYFKNNKTGYDCYNNNMPQDLDECRAPVVVWAIGGGPTYYPKEAGYPFGHNEAPDYYMIEIHYDNPQLIAGKVDSSGLRLTLTKSLRQYDAGIIAAGAVFGITAPPKVKDFQHHAFCTKSCTEQLLKEEIKIFGAALHGHLATRQVITRQFRNGKELRVIDEDRHYDFNYQQSSMYEKPLDMLPGDELMVTCHYDTQKRSKMTYGDLPSESEMCISYLFHYPAQQLSECYTVSGWVNGWETRNFLANHLKYPTTSKYQDFKTTFNKITQDGDWTDERIKAMEKGTLDFPQMDWCTNLERRFMNGFMSTKYSPPAAARNPPPKRDFEVVCSKDEE